MNASYAGYESYLNTLIDANKGQAERIHRKIVGDGSVLTSTDIKRLQVSNALAIAATNILRVMGNGEGELRQNIQQLMDGAMDPDAETHIATVAVYHDALKTLSD